MVEEANGTCVGGWWSEPPPDSILTLPPPPLPAFLQPPPGPCAPPPCDPTAQPAVEFIELSRAGGSGSAAIDDTWLLVLISCSVGVLLLGSLLALILLKCREKWDCHCRERGGKIEQEGKNGRGCEAVLYPPGAALWATLTPRGTTHVTAPLFDNTGFLESNDYCPLRPRLVSSPTRIENPNLPPLNLHRTLRRPPQVDHTPVL